MLLRQGIKPGRLACTPVGVRLLDTHTLSHVPCWSDSHGSQCYGRGRAHGCRALAIPEPLPREKRMCVLCAGAGLTWVWVSRGLTQLNLSVQQNQHQTRVLSNTSRWQKMETSDVYKEPRGRSQVQRNRQLSLVLGRLRQRILS